LKSNHNRGSPYNVISRFLSAQRTSIKYGYYFRLQINYVVAHKLRLRIAVTYVINVNMPAPQVPFDFLQNMNII